MKLKGLGKTMLMLDELDEELGNKIDNIQWTGNNDTMDQGRDEMCNEAIGNIDEAKEALQRIIDMRIEEFI